MKDFRFLATIWNPQTEEVGNFLVFINTEDGRRAWTLAIEYINEQFSSNAVLLDMKYIVGDYHE